MRIFYVLAAAALMASCNNSGTTAKTFCDTACSSDSIIFNGTGNTEAQVAIGIRDCYPDSVSWTHGGMGISRHVPMNDLTNKEVRLNKNFINCVFQDTSHAWLSFNDCITGRGYLFKLPYNKVNNIVKVTGAINSFDPKFVLHEDLRAYTDRGSVFVVNVRNNKEAMMTFKEEYNIDFDKIHEVVDSVNISKSRIYVKLKKNGADVPLEKKVELE